MREVFFFLAVGMFWAAQGWPLASALLVVVAYGAVKRWYLRWRAGRHVVRM